MIRRDQAHPNTGDFNEVFGERWQDAEPTGSSAVLTVVYLAAFLVLSYAVVIWLIGMLGQ